MKTREGFVSNSSSSSFIIVGVDMTGEEFKKRFQLEKMQVSLGSLIESVDAIHDADLETRNDDERVFIGIQVCSYIDDCGGTTHLGDPESFQRDIRNAAKYCQGGFDKLGWTDKPTVLFGTARG